MSDTDMKTVRAAARALQVFETLSQTGPAPVTVLAERTGLAFSTVQRLLNTLQSRGWVYRRISENTYAVSYAHLKKLVKRKTVVPLAEAAVPHMMAASSETGLPIFLGKFIADGIVEMVESTFAPTPEMPLDPVYGLRPSAVFGAVGVSQLAVMSASDRARHLDAIEASGTRAERQLIKTKGFQGTLQAARRDGYALRTPDYSPENYAGEAPVWILAVPICWEGSVLGALSLGCKHDEHEWDHVVNEIIPTLQRHAAQIAESATALLGAAPSSAIS